MTFDFSAARMKIESMVQGAIVALPNLVFALLALVLSYFVATRMPASQEVTDRSHQPQNGQ